MKSIVCVTRNRTPALKIALASWNQSGADQIIIVDWGSDEFLNIDSPKVKILRVENATDWQPTIALNLAFSCVEEGEILKLDVDYILNPYYDFFKYCKLDLKTYYAGGDFDGSWYLHGLLYCNKVDFDRVNGYNERLSGYGHDDHDIYGRLSVDHVRKFIPIDLVYHLNHPDSYRGNSHLESDRLNKIKSMSRPWTLKDSKQSFDIKWQGRFGTTTFVKSGYKIL